MNAYLISLIRTYVPIGVGAVVSWLLVHSILSVSLSAQSAVTAVLTAGVTAAYYAGVRALEVRFPKWPWGALLGHSATPSYKKGVAS
jgi:hypothetical protein